jgi:hypothetical protein
MSPVERLRAAIEVLEHLKAESTPGRWEILGGGDRFVSWLPEVPVGFAYVLAEPVEFEQEADADLIVVLHRTVDAQLAILAYGVTLVGPVPESILALADAILGSDS